MPVAPTPRDTLLVDGPARLYRFHRRDDRTGEPGLPVLRVPSLINRWYVLDLRHGVSLAASLLDAGFDVFCLDWGVSEDEDRYLTWDDMIRRLRRAVRRVCRVAGVDRVGLFGYCLGGTMAGIYAALEPDRVAALVTLAAPFDFSEGGVLTEMTDPSWFDPEAIGDAGNLPAHQMQTAFIALRPTTQVSKWINLWHRAHDEEMRVAFRALEIWANDNVPFPGAAYGTYVKELYQENLLVHGRHRVWGRQVRLGNIRCAVLAVTAERDHICPPAAARAVVDQSASTDRELMVVPGGHVGIVVGSSAPRKLYPAVATWLRPRLAPRADLPAVARSAN
jgi:polyhydroxyalkanoate synthase